MITLESIASQLERMLNEQADMRDELRVIRVNLMSVEVAVDSLRRQVERMLRRRTSENHEPARERL